MDREVVKEGVKGLVFEGIVRGQVIKRDGIKVRVEEAQGRELAGKIKVAGLAEKVSVKKAGFKGFVEEVSVGQVSAESSSSLRRRLWQYLPSCVVNDWIGYMRYMLIYYRRINRVERYIRRKYILTAVIDSATKCSVL